MTELLFGTARKVLGISRKYARPAFEQHDAGALGIDRMEFVFQYVARDFGQGAGELYASRAAAHDHKIERRVPASFGGIAFRQLKGQQHAAANFDSVFDGFQPRCQRFPFIVSEISMAGSSGNDQIVVRNIAIAKFHNFPREIEILHVAHEHLNIAIAAENPADGGGDFARRQTRSRHLIEQRLKSVAALWTPPGRLDLAWMILTAAFILVMAFRGPYSAREMGVTFPTGKATIWIVGAGLILAATLWSFAALTGADAAPTHAMPLRTTWQYAVWAFLQQFML